MKQLFYLPVALSLLFLSSCQPPQDQLPGYMVRTPDNIAGNDSVPDVYTLSSAFQRVIVTRFKYQTDVLEGLKEAVEKEGIKNAVILSGIGSVISYHVHAVANSTFPTENVYYQKEEPMDLLSVNGYVFNGRVHAHISLSNEEYAIGGHLETGTRVFTFCIITLGILGDDAPIERFDDKSLR